MLNSRPSTSISAGSSAMSLRYRPVARLSLHPTHFAQRGPALHCSTPGLDVCGGCARSRTNLHVHIHTQTSTPATDTALQAGASFSHAPAASSREIAEVPGVPNPACRLEKDPLAGLEAKRRWGPPASGNPRWISGLTMELPDTRVLGIAGRIAQGFCVSMNQRLMQSLMKREGQFE
jgi:hypothetical protein